jgi:hypothetical protein
MRVETGPVQFGDEDWPGIFIRGDQALHFSFTLKALIDCDVEGLTEIERAILRGLADTLGSCAVPVADLTIADARTP